MASSLKTLIYIAQLHNKTLQSALVSGARVMGMCGEESDFVGIDTLWAWRVFEAIGRLLYCDDAA